MMRGMEKFAGAREGGGNHPLERQEHGDCAHSEHNEDENLFEAFGAAVPAPEAIYAKAAVAGLGNVCGMSLIMVCYLT